MPSVAGAANHYEALSGVAGGAWNSQEVEQEHACRARTSAPAAAITIAAWILCSCLLRRLTQGFRQAGRSRRVPILHWVREPGQGCTRDGTALCILAARGVTPIVLEGGAGRVHRPLSPAVSVNWNLCQFGEGDADAAPEWDRAHAVEPVGEPACVVAEEVGRLTQGDGLLG